MLTAFSFFHSFTKEALKSCREDILKHNAHSLFSISFIAAIMAGIFAFVPLFIEKRVEKFTIYIIMAVVECFIAFYASCLHKRDKCKPLLINIGFLFLYISLMAFGTFLDLFERPYSNVSIILVFLVGAQISFVINILWNLILNMSTVIVFLIIAIRVKPFDIWLIDAVSVIIAAFVGIIITQYTYYTVIKGMIAARRLEMERNRFREESIRDELTGLSNRRDYFHAVNFYISVCQHVHQTVCAIMMDVDFFKQYNDFYGHPKGDIVLQSIGKVLQSLIVEERVFAARVGGEEFIVLWTENRIAEVERVAVKLLQKIIDLQIPHEKSSVASYVTASLGVYILRGGSADSVDALYSNVDAALYAAKRHGRNCIMLQDSADKTPRLVKLLPPEKNVGRR
jgi:diguanylate cyclase (GGDEF)-like protein